MRSIERNSYVGFFKTAGARALLFDGKCTLESLLQRLVGDENFYRQYLFDQQFGHRGWSGIVSAIGDKPDTLLYRKEIALRDLILLELLLEIDALNRELGNEWLPLAQKAPLQPLDLFVEPAGSELREVLVIWQDAFEWSYYDEVLSALRHAHREGDEPAEPDTPSFQAIFCIDEREASLRRHLEQTDPRCETFGSPGFFGVEFCFQPPGGKFYEKLCPLPAMPSCAPTSCWYRLRC